MKTFLLPFQPIAARPSAAFPQRLVQDGLIDDTAAHTALRESRESSFVTQLVANGSARARDIAIAASAEFGVPIFDLEALNVDMDVAPRLREAAFKHRVLPLFKRGKKLFLGVSDPTNLHAIDEIKFQTGLGVEAVVVDDDKLQKAVDRAIENADAQMPNLGDDEGVDLDGLEVSGGEESKPKPSVGTTSKTRRSSAS